MGSRKMWPPVPSLDGAGMSQEERQDFERMWKIQIEEEQKDQQGRGRGSDVTRYPNRSASLVNYSPIQRAPAARPHASAQPRRSLDGTRAGAELSTRHGTTAYSKGHNTDQLRDTSKSTISLSSYHHPRPRIYADPVPAPALQPQSYGPSGNQRLASQYHQQQHGPRAVAHPAFEPSRYAKDRVAPNYAHITDAPASYHKSGATRPHPGDKRSKNAKKLVAVNVNIPLCEQPYYFSSVGKPGVCVKDFLKNPKANEVVDGYKRIPLDQYAKWEMRWPGYYGETYSLAIGKMPTFTEVVTALCKCIKMFVENEQGNRNPQQEGEIKELGAEGIGIDAIWIRNFAQLADENLKDRWTSQLYYAEG